MSKSKERAERALYFRVPCELDHRIDAEVLRRRIQSGQRITRTAVLVEILEEALQGSANFKQ